MMTCHRVTRTHTGCGAWEQRHSHSFNASIRPLLCRQRVKDYVLKAKPIAVERGSQSLSNILWLSVFVPKDMMI